MADILEARKDEILIQVESLSTEEEEELLEFLKTQPEVRSASRRFRTLDSANLSRETLGFIVRQHDVLVRVAEGLAKSAAVSTLVFGLLNRWLDRRKAEKKEEQDKMETVSILGSDGRTVKLVKRPKNQ